MRDRITIFDTTLRDGEQAPGCTMHTARSCAWRAARAAGRRRHRGGLPDRLRRRLRGGAGDLRGVKGARVAALCRAQGQGHRARRAGARARALRPRIHTFIATSDIHLEQKLRITPEEALEAGREAVELARTFTRRGRVLGRGRLAQRLRLPAEVCRPSSRPGRRRSTCPTRSATRCRRVRGDVRASSCRLPGAVISAHCHNDLGLAVANSLAAVAGGRAPGRMHDQRHRRARRQRLARGDRDGAEGAPRLLGFETGIRTELLRRRAAALDASPASGRSRTRRSSAATRSPTRRASTRTACSRTRSATRS